MILSAFASFLCALGISCDNVSVVKKAGKSCSVSGKTVDDGATFVTTLTGPCVKYLCKNGAIFPGEYGCERDGSCFPLGDSINLGCIQRKCAPSNGKFGYVTAKEGCSYRNSCFQVNQIFQDRCFTYKCFKYGGPSSVTYSMELTDWGCEYENQCYPANHTLKQECRTLRCTHDNGAYGFVTENQGCLYGSKCIQVDETTVDSCRTYQCVKTNFGDIPFYSVSIVTSLCQDALGNCKFPSTRFSYIMNGVLRQNCTCSVTSGNVLYTC